MLKYFRKIKNFNRIKKLIKTNPVRFEGTFGEYPVKTINKYFCENIIMTFIVIRYNHNNYEEKYVIESENKKIDLNENQIEILYELAKEKHQKPY